MNADTFSLLQFADEPTVWAIVLLALFCFVLEFNLILGEHGHEWQQRTAQWLKVLPVLLSALPLLGLLGTIAGLLETFATLAGSGTKLQAMLSGGIADALVTTQLGLIMVIPGLLLLAYIRHRYRSHGA